MEADALVEWSNIPVINIVSLHPGEGILMDTDLVKGKA